MRGLWLVLLVACSAAAAEPPCAVVEGAVRACAAPAAWRPVEGPALAPEGGPSIGIEAAEPASGDPAAAEADLTFDAGPGLMAALVVRPLGRDAGNGAEVMRRHVLEVAVERSGLLQHQTSVLADEAASVDGRDAGLIVHRLSSGPTAAVVADTFLVGPDFALEAITTQARTNVYTPAHREAHAALLAMIRLDGAP